MGDEIPKVMSKFVTLRKESVLFAMFNVYKSVTVGLFLFQISLL